ncbi:hypothetical protein JP28_08230 [Gallibacterium anatis]|uniref:hypothetical protein n=1 Tax=Gallibacterium anatis TaxID=750 RepID=UPI0005311BD6|nr:hypothetical protein [Gallibacterium anatis]KGQ43590.1 hypothetical protein JP28_08230 [Gallibacterium anatis]KGQ53122.1 hypothetical protein IO46_04085 [Gallibacterium anatis]KGQ59687.1 hypothetical protein IO45_05890 [Gallibacterium anatis]
MKKILTTLALAASLNVQAAPVMNFFELGIAQGQHAEFNQVGKHTILTPPLPTKKEHWRCMPCSRANKPSNDTLYKCLMMQYKLK